MGMIPGQERRRRNTSPSSNRNGKNNKKVSSNEITLLSFRLLDLEYGTKNAWLALSWGMDKRKNGGGYEKKKKGELENKRRWSLALEAGLEHWHGRLVRLVWRDVIVAGEAWVVARVRRWSRHRCCQRGQCEKSDCKGGEFEWRGQVHI